MCHWLTEFRYELYHLRHEGLRSDGRISIPLSPLDRGDGKQNQIRYSCKTSWATVKKCKLGQSKLWIHLTSTIQSSTRFDMLIDGRIVKYILQRAPRVTLLLELSDNSPSKSLKFFFWIKLVPMLTGATLSCHVSCKHPLDESWQYHCVIYLYSCLLQWLYAKGATKFIVWSSVLVNLYFWLNFRHDI